VTIIGSITIAETPSRNMPKQAEGVVVSRNGFNEYVIESDRNQVTLTLENGSLEIGEKIYLTRMGDTLIIKKHTAPLTFPHDAFTSQHTSPEQIKSALHNTLISLSEQLPSCPLKNTIEALIDIIPQQDFPKTALQHVFRPLLKQLHLIATSPTDISPKALEHYAKQIEQLSLQLAKHEPSIALVTTADPAERSLRFFPDRQSALEFFRAISSTPTDTLKASLPSAPNEPVYSYLFEVSPNTQGVFFLKKNDLHHFLKQLQPNNFNTIPHQFIEPLISERGELDLTILSKLPVVYSGTLPAPNVQHALQSSPSLVSTWLHSLLDIGSQSPEALLRFPFPTNQLVSEVSKIGSFLSQLNPSLSFDILEQFAMTDGEHQNSESKTKLLHTAFSQLGYNFEHQINEGMLPLSTPDKPNLKGFLIELLAIISPHIPSGPQNVTYMPDTVLEDQLDSLDNIHSIITTTADNEKREQLFLREKDIESALLHHLRKLPGVENNGIEQAVPISKHKPLFYGQLRQSIETALEQLDTLQLLSRKLTTTSEERQSIVMPVKIDHQWTELRIQFIKKRKKKKGTNGQQGYGIHLSVTPSRSGHIDVDLLYQKNTRIQLKMRFEKLTTKEWFSEQKALLQKALHDSGLGSVHIELQHSVKKPTKKTDHPNGIMKNSDNEFDITV
jgi:hypothetical protein